MTITTATTLTNPNEVNDNEARYIMIKMHTTEQEVKALYINPITLDQREQKPNIKIGSEVFVLIDDYYSFFVIGTTQQKISLLNDKIYLIENEQQIELKTDNLIIGGVTNAKTENFTIEATNTTINTTKMVISNGSDEILALMSELIDTLKSGVWVGNLSAPVPMSTATKTLLEDINSRLQAFQ